ncbi:hypothetical protein EZS27_000756 [termite gut metagenome]|uniref:HipA-like C-terminal domain-containing protein n=1 Tax=termite gut metagenome TaxID=433724 RepID=A0A5J4T0I3_9ZZZZ
MAPGSDSYGDIFALIRRLNLPYEDSLQQYLRMVFNVIFRNVDDHAKNFAFCMTRDGKWSLSPAYDLTYSIDLTAPSYSNRHSLTVNGKKGNITRTDLETVAINNDIQDYKALIDAVAHTVDKFKEYAKELNINELIIKSICSDFVLM